MNIDFPQDIIRGTFSIPKSKDIEYLNIKFQKIILQNEVVVQFAYYMIKYFMKIFLYLK